MTEQTSTAPDIEQRQRWIGVMARSSRDELEAAAQDKLGGVVPPFTWLREPEVGLAMVRGRAGGTGDQFNLGEMTVTRCTLRLETGVTGTSYVAGRDTQHAALAALLDAVFQSDPAGSDAVVDGLEIKLAARTDTAGRQAAATKVDFFTMVRGENPK